LLRRFRQVGNTCAPVGGVTGWLRTGIVIMVLLLYKGLPFNVTGSSMATMRSGQLHLLELVPFRRFDSCTSGLTLRALKASYCPIGNQTPPSYRLYFLNSPVSTFTTLYPLLRACCRYAFSTAFVPLVFGIRKGLADDSLVLGYAICCLCWSDGCAGISRVLLAMASSSEGCNR